MKHLSFLLVIIIASLTLADFAAAYKSVQFATEFGGKGEALGKFTEKTRLAFDKDSNIYVVDTDNARFQKLNPNGQPVMEIASGAEFLFTSPMDIAVDGELNIYVSDWKSVYIQGTDAPRIFNYGPCIHKFSRDGKFVATFTLEDLAKKAAEKESAVPAIDTDGNFALMIMPQKPDRIIYITADLWGNVYALDQDTIYKLSPSGEVLLHFAGPGQLDGSSDLDVDGKGNIYIADTGNHRIVKFSPDGKFLLSFGREGDTDGRLMDKLYVTTASDGTVFVADSAKYEKTFKTSLKQRKLIDSTILVTGQDDPIIPRRREFETLIRRFQRFDEDGRFMEKILYRTDKSDPELRGLEFKAIDPNGNLYLVNKDRLVIRKYSIYRSVQWSSVEKVFTYHFQRSVGRERIDNFYDINPDFDFDEREKYTLMTGTFRLNYDMTEAFRVSLDSSLLHFNSTIYDNYPGEWAEPRGYIQDDKTTDKYSAMRIRLDLSLILDHDPFKYRVGNLFVFFGGGRYDFNIAATNTITTDLENKRRLDEDLWWSIWAAGMSYDMGSSLRFSLLAAQHRPPGFMNYDYSYWDEQGKLYATGFGSGASTEVFISIDGAF